jgi:hypothetical protein
MECLPPGRHGKSVLECKSLLLRFESLKQTSHQQAGALQLEEEI